MNSKVLYPLIGLLAGSVATVGLLLLSTKVAPQAVILPDRTLAHPFPMMLAQVPGSGAPLQPGRMMMQSDARFIIMMIPHHQDAVAMANLALTQAKHPEIKQLAQAIKTTQTQEIEQMRTWYKQWYGSDVPSVTVGMGMGGMGMGGMGMGGMGMGRQSNLNCSQAINTAPGRRTGQPNPTVGTAVPGMGCGRGVDLNALKTASDFDRTFIEQMIPHHQMAVRMTHMIQNSTRPEMQALGTSIVKTQTSEINQMQQWYQQWYR